MRVLRNFLPSVVKFVLRFRRGRDGGRDGGDGGDGDGQDREGVVGATSVRTYAAGGDPFEDRIEFHLGGRSGDPGGFRDPR